MIGKYNAPHDTRMFSYTSGIFHIEVEQKYLETMSKKNARHFWTVIGKCIKEDEKRAKASQI